MKRQLEKVTIIHLILHMIIVVLFTACNNKPTLFKQIPSSQTGIHFNNAITENDSINPIDLEFLYNGGGVAVGDFNKDELRDLYITASTSANKLYLNKGSLKFEDITRQAGVAGEGRWSNAASVDASMDAVFFTPTVTSNLFTEITAAVGINYFNRGP